MKVRLDKWQEVNLLNLTGLSFYSDQYTIGDKPVEQLQCKSGGNECDEFRPKIIYCKNEDYMNLKKVNETELSWSCDSKDLKLSSYYIKQNSSHVKCQDQYRSDSGIFVVQGSCYLIYEQAKSGVYRNLLVGFIFILVVSLVVGFYFYCKTKRSGYEPIV